MQRLQEFSLGIAMILGMVAATVVEKCRRYLDGSESKWMDLTEKS